ncbi:hypothetical protein BRC83_01090 [Halobacteriales archaeon QS_1_68_17]|nr:MAG: hypothetical protein BRC83_01090 [Halobacteriales archaeon QS_1_68_17]
MERATERQLLGAALVGSLLAATAVLLSPSTVLREARALSADPVAFGAALVGLYLLRPVLAWPISACSILVGYVLGFEVGVPVALAGAVFTCLPPFVLARRTQSGEGLLGRVGDAGERLVAVTGATRGVFAARLAPLPADAVSYAAGVSGLSAGAYVLGTALGELPWAIVTVLAGSSMRRLTVEGVDPGLPLVGAAVGVAVLVLAGPAYRHLRDGPAVRGR